MAGVIGIRREDKSKWERRVPIVPRDVHRLRSEHAVGVVVQPSGHRAFGDEEFVLAGATIQEDLSSCSAIFGIKEIPSYALEPGLAYVFFAHVIKGQPTNMAMLQRILDLGCTLIDYEKITDDQGRRLIFFGRQAGQAGMVDTLWALGQRLKWEGIANPFQALLPMPQYGGLAPATAALDVVGEWIRSAGVPSSLAPLVIGIAGYGNVSAGAQEILDRLPTIEIDPSDLARLGDDPDVSRHHVYKVVFKEKHMVERLEQPERFLLQEYYDQPQRYRGVFAQYLRHLTVLVNAIYWAPQYPRLVTKASLAGLFAADQVPKLRVIGDISCDVEGAIEATTRSTDPGSPVYVYDPASGQTVDGYAGNGPVIMAVDILPSELPRESSAEFSLALQEFIPALAAADFTAPFDDLSLPAPIKRAVISHRGVLTPDYQYLSQYLEKGI